MNDANVPPIYDFNNAGDSANIPFIIDQDTDPTPEPVIPGVVPTNDTSLGLWWNQIFHENPSDISVVDGGVIMPNNEIVNAFSSGYQFLNDTEFFDIDYNAPAIVISNVYWEIGGIADFGFIGINRSASNSNMSIVLSHRGIGQNPLVYNLSGSFISVSNISIINGKLLITGIGRDGYGYFTLLDLSAPSPDNIHHRIIIPDNLNFLNLNHTFATLPVTYNGETYYLTVYYEGDNATTRSNSLGMIVQDAGFNYISRIPDLWSRIANGNVASSTQSIMGFGLNVEGLLVFELLRSDGEVLYTSDTNGYDISSLLLIDADITPVDSTGTQPAPSSGDEPVLEATPAPTEETAEVTEVPPIDPPEPEGVEGFDLNDSVFPTNPDDINFLWNRFFNSDATNLQFNDIASINTPGNQFDTEISFNSINQVYRGVFEISGVSGEGYIAMYRDPVTSVVSVLLNHASFTGPVLLQPAASYSNILNIVVTRGELLIIGKGIDGASNYNFITRIGLSAPHSSETLWLDLQGFSFVSAQYFVNQSNPYILLVAADGVQPVSGLQYFILGAYGSRINSRSLSDPGREAVSPADLEGFEIIGEDDALKTIVFNYNVNGATTSVSYPLDANLNPINPTPNPTEEPDVVEEAPTCQSQINTFLSDMPSQLFTQFPSIMDVGVGETFNSDARLTAFDEAVELIRNIFHGRYDLPYGYHVIRFNIGIQENGTINRSGFRVLILRNNAGYTFAMDFIPENPNDDDFVANTDRSVDGIIRYLNSIRRFGDHLSSITLGTTTGNNLQFEDIEDEPDGIYQMGVVGSYSDRVFIFDGMDEELHFVENPRTQGTGRGRTITIRDIDNPREYRFTNSSSFSGMSGATIVECQ